MSFSIHFQSLLKALLENFQKEASPILVSQETLLQKILLDLVGNNYLLSEKYQTKEAAKLAYNIADCCTNPDTQRIVNEFYNFLKTQAHTEAPTSLQVDLNNTSPSPLMMSIRELFSTAATSNNKEDHVPLCEAITSIFMLGYKPLIEDLTKHNDLALKFYLSQGLARLEYHENVLKFCARVNLYLKFPNASVMNILSAFSEGPPLRKDFSEPLGSVYLETEHYTYLSLYFFFSYRLIANNLNNNDEAFARLALYENSLNKKEKKNFEIALSQLSTTRVRLENFSLKNPGQLLINPHLLSSLREAAIENPSDFFAFLERSQLLILEKFFLLSTRIHFLLSISMIRSKLGLNTRLETGNKRDLADNNPTLTTLASPSSDPKEASSLTPEPSVILNLKKGSTLTKEQHDGYVETLLNDINFDSLANRYQALIEIHLLQYLNNAVKEFSKEPTSSSNATAFCRVISSLLLRRSDTPVIPHVLNQITSFGGITCSYFTLYLYKQLIPALSGIKPDPLLICILESEKNLYPECLTTRNLNSLSKVSQALAQERNTAGPFRFQEILSIRQVFEKHPELLDALYKTRRLNTEEKAFILSRINLGDMLLEVYPFIHRLNEQLNTQVIPNSDTSSLFSLNTFFSTTREGSASSEEEGQAIVSLAKRPHC